MFVRAYHSSSVKIKTFQEANNLSADLLVNVTLQSGADELIVSMDLFSSELSSVTCQDNDLSLTFTNQDTYEAAISDWEWVNLAQNRNFIMIVNYGGCDAEDGRQPWVVTGATYDATHFNVQFNATQKSWSELGNDMSIEWGSYVAPTPSTTAKRFSLGSLLPSISKSLGTHTLSLAHTIDKTFFSKTTQSGLDFSVNCNNCATKGSLAISGKITVGGTNSLTVTAVPQDIELDLGLELDVSGTLGSGWQKDFQLFTAGIPGFSIVDVIEIGPQFSIGAGFDLSGVAGTASISSGITANIPNSATASLDILGSDTSFTGWTPTISHQPIQVTAEIDGSLQIYTEVDLDIGITAFGAGYGAGFTLKVPDVTLNVGAGFNNLGFCPGNKDMFGVTFDGGVGADLSMNAYSESKDVKTNKWSKDLFNKPDLFTFPSACIAIGNTAPTSPIKMSSTSSATTTTHSSTSSATKATSTTKASSTSSKIITSSSAKPTGTTSRVSTLSSKISSVNRSSSASSHPSSTLSTKASPSSSSSKLSGTAPAYATKPAGYYAYPTKPAGYYSGKLRRHVQ
jgi:hypothetical protein